MKFYARSGFNVYTHGAKFVGQANNYMGQRWIEGSVTTALIHTEEPFECERTTPDGKKAIKACRAGELWPADRETASVCRVPFMELEYFDSQWVLKRPVKSTKVKE